jgi:hypothetical protein
LSYEHRTAYTGEPVGADPTLSPPERETGFTMSDDDEMIRFSSYQPSFLRGILDADGVTITDVYLAGRVIVGAMGYFPRSMLAVKKARNGNAVGRIVSGAIRCGRVPKVAGKARHHLTKAGRAERAAHV